MKYGFLGLVSMQIHHSSFNLPLYFLSQSSHLYKYLSVPNIIGINSSTQVSGIDLYWKYEKINNVILKLEK